MPYLLNNPATTIIRYNGLDFPPHSRIKVSTRPEYSADGRHLKYRHYIVTIESTWTAEDFFLQAPSGQALASGDPLESQMLFVRRLLTEPRKDFYLTDQGFGDFNPVTSMDDQNFGPKPQELLWEPVGNRRACHTVYRIELTLGCEEAQSALWHQFSYAVDFDINTQGITTRTITGIAEVNGQVVGQQVMAGGADDYRDQIQFPVPIGFHRTQNWRLSGDRKTLYFRLVDSQIASDNPFFPGVERMSIRHRVSLVLGTTGSVPFWSSTFTGGVVLMPGVPRDRAWVAFLAALAPRLEMASGYLMIPFNISLEEEMYGYDLAFQVSYIIKSEVLNLPQGLQRTGIFQPGVHNWAEWSNSMAQPHSPRGYAGMYHSGQGEQVPDICVTSNPTFGNSHARLFAPNTALPFFHTQRPPAENSWLNFDWKGYFVRLGGSVAHVPLGSVDGTRQLDAAVRPSHDGTLVDIAAAIVGGAVSAGAIKNILQDQSPSRYVYHFSGVALRAGYHIPIPYVRSIGGVAPTVKFEQIEHSHVVKTMGGVKIYKAGWSRIYHVPGGAPAPLDIVGIPPEWRPD